LYLVDRDIRITPSRRPAPPGELDLPRFDVSVETPWRKHTDVPVPLPGIHQTTNAGLALAAMDVLDQHGFPCPQEPLVAGLAAVRCPLRVEVMQRRPLVIVDSAHNGASMEALCQTLASVPVRRRVAVFGTSRDKDAAVMLRKLDESFDELILTQYLSNPRALPIDEMAAVAADLKTPWKTATSPQNALQLARQSAGEQDLICITGSFFLAAETRELLTTPRDSLEQAPASG
ncbi:MAG: glutamate ligase domain-containing protein, partial [Maioricimonas sp. JB049]